MKNEYIKTPAIQIDYQAMLDALIEKTNEVYYKNKDSLRMGLPSTVRELRTVGFFVGRQSGKTETIIDFISKKQLGECLLIVKDDFTQRSLTAKYNKKNSTTTIVPHLPTCTLRDKVKHGAEPEKELYERIKYILIDDASYTLNFMGVTDANFMQWVANNFAEDVLVIRIG